ncbi:hypothetical protein [Streptomyces sp. NPDC058665]
MIAADWSYEVIGREVATVATRDRAVLDEITEPRLLTGDSWTVH